jgi:hypothetical protein
MMKAEEKKGKEKVKEIRVVRVGQSERAWVCGMVREGGWAVGRCGEGRGGVGRRGVRRLGGVDAVTDCPPVFSTTYIIGTRQPLVLLRCPQLSTRLIDIASIARGPILRTC